MNILMGSILNFDEDINGVVVSTRELMDELNSSDHQVNLITPFDQKITTVSSWFLKVSGFLFKRVGWQLLFMLNLWIKAWIIARKTWSIRHEIDVFHAHDPLAALAFMMIQGNGKKIFFQAHFNGSPWMEFVEAGYVPKEGWAQKILKAAFSRLMRSNHVQILAVSEHSKNQIHNLLGTLVNEPVVFYPGIPTTHFVSDESETEQHILNVGTLEERKDQLAAVNLIASLRKLGLKPQLHFVGPENSAYKQRILDRVGEYGLHDQVHFHGQLNAEETREMIGRADLYLHTAVEESFGRVLVEAISSATPVAAFAYPAVHEILDDDLILERTADSNSHANLLKNILTDPILRRALQETQYASYLNRFTPHKMIQDYRQIISQS